MSSSAVIVPRQVEYDEQPRRLGRQAQQIVVPALEGKVKVSFVRFAQIDGCLQLEIERRAHRPAGLNPQVHAVPVRVGDGRGVAGPRRYGVRIGAGEGFFPVGNG